MNLSDQNNLRKSVLDKSANIRAKKVLLLEPDKEQAKLFITWLKEENYEVKAVFVLGEVIDIVSKEAFDLFIMDIDPSTSLGIDPEQSRRGDAPDITDKYLGLCQTLKKDAHAQGLPVTILTYRKDIKKIAGAIESGADNFVLKPFETDSFLDRIEAIFKEIELKKQGKKVLDLNYINYLIALTGELEHEDFFMLASVIFNKLIIEKINTILSEPIIAQIIKRCNELVGSDYTFMKGVRFSGGRVLMDGVDKISEDAPVKKLTLAFRDYVYGFLHLVRTLTSDILMERG